MNISELIVNNASSFCPAESYEIDKVLDGATGREYTESEYSNKMKLDKATNIWSFTDLNNVIIDAHIYFKVYNGLQWIKGQHLVEVNLFSPEC